MAKKRTSVFSAEILDERLEGQDPATVLRSNGLDQRGHLKRCNYPPNNQNASKRVHQLESIM